MSIHVSNGAVKEILIEVFTRTHKTFERPAKEYTEGISETISKSIAQGI